METIKIHPRAYNTIKNSLISKAKREGKKEDFYFKEIKPKKNNYEFIY